jgi:hypothetical protein
MLHPALRPRLENPLRFQAALLRRAPHLRLHTHAFVFLSTLIIIGLGFLLALKSTALTAVASTFLGFAVLIQLLFAIRRVYRQNWFATLFKFALGSLIYLVLLSIAFAVTAMITLVLP